MNRESGESGPGLKYKANRIPKRLNVYSFKQRTTDPKLTKPLTAAGTRQAQTPTFKPAGS